MHRNGFRKAFLWASAMALVTGTGCTSYEAPDETQSTQGQGGSASATGSGGTGDGGQGGAPTVDLGIEDAPAAPALAHVSFDLPVTRSVAAGPYVFLLYEEKDCGILDLTEPESPVQYGPIATQAEVVAVAYDEANRLAYLADEAGSVTAVDLTSLEAPVVRGNLAVPTIANATELVRVGDRLFALSGGTLQPLGVTRKPDGSVDIGLETPVSLPKPGVALVAGGGVLYVGDADGNVASYSAQQGKKPVKLGQFALGGPLRGLVARGSKLFGAASGVGLRVVDFGKPDAPSLVFETNQVADATELRLFGRTLVVGLERQAIATIDVSDPSRPRAVTNNPGKLPAWIAVSRGHLFFGGSSDATVGGVPPYVSGRLPGPTRERFPATGLVPVTMSKEIDPASVSPDSVTLRCNGEALPGTPIVSPDRLTVRFVPAAPLPLGAQCQLDVSGVRDASGQQVSAGEDGAIIAFETDSEAPKEIVNPGSKYPHTIDGGFSDWTPEAGEGAEYEYFDVTPAKGMYTYFYADFDGESLWLLNDWFYNGENIEPDCYNQFNVWTGGGSEQWEVRAYGDQHVEVRKNGELVDPEAEGVEGGAFYGPSPNLAEAHTQYEIRVPASGGGWGVQLHDPGPTFYCGVLEQEPSSMQGDIGGGASGKQTTVTVGGFVPPTAPQPLAPQDGAIVDLPVTLSWQVPEGPISTFYQVQVATDQSFAPSTRLVDALTYGSSFTIPSALLKKGKYFWHLIAWNPAGSAAGGTQSFTVGGREGLPPEAKDDLAATQPNVAVLIFVLSNDTDPDGDPLFISDVTKPMHGTAVIADNGIVYTPKQGFSGLDAFIYTVTDNKDGSDQGIVTVQVGAGNSSPVATNDFASTTAGKPVQIAVLANDSDPDGDNLILSEVASSVGGLAQPSFQTGIVTFTPAPGFTGLGGFQYTVTDGKGGFASASVEVEVLPAQNQPPVAVDDVASVSAGKSVNIFVLDNDTDPDNDPLQVVEVAESPNATITIDPIDQQFVTYTPKPGFTGTDTFDYTVTDGQYFDSGKVTVTVQPQQQGADAKFGAPSAFGTGATPLDLATGDLNGDGRPDLVTANNGGGSVSVLINSMTAGAVTPKYMAKVDLESGEDVVAVALGDLNNDGKLDVVAVNRNPGTLSVRLNTTTSSFAPTFGAKIVLQVGSMPSGAAIGDLDLDGRNDIAVSRGDGTVLVAHNATAPGASNVTLGQTATLIAMGLPVGVTLADMDGDGLLDVLTADSNSSYVSVFPNTLQPAGEPPSFMERVDVLVADQASSIAVADFNLDGRVDFAASSLGSSEITVVLNTTKPGTVPSFAEKESLDVLSPGARVIAKDFNLDGRPDLAVTDAGVASVFVNVTAPGAGTAAFGPRKEFVTSGNAPALASADWSGDGKPDLASVDKAKGQVQVLLNTTQLAPKATFAMPATFTTAAAPFAVALGDLNRDGKKDVVVAGNDKVTVLLNQTVPGGQATFAAKTEHTVGTSATAVALADLNQDGTLDVVTANNESEDFTVLLNQTPQGAAVATFAAKKNFAVGSTAGLVVGDVSFDGIPDVIVSNPPVVSVFVNTTPKGAMAATFAPKVDLMSSPLGIGLADINLDGKLDLVTTTGVHLNQTQFGGQPTFGMMGFMAGPNPRALGLGDLNLDGRIDLAIANSVQMPGTVTTLINLTGESPGFGDPQSFIVGAQPWDLVMGDFDRDGRVDMAVTNQNGASISVLVNSTSPGSFEVGVASTITLAPGNFPRGLAAGDINHDGKLDLVTVTSGAAVLLQQ